MGGADDPVDTIDDDDFVTTAPRRRWWRKKRLLIPLTLLAALIMVFWALQTPDTDRDAMIAKYGQPGGETLFARGPAGQSIHYRDQGRGDGPVMVLLHGSNASLHTWEPLVARLGGTYRIITMDLPGHGLTGAVPDGNYGVAGMMAAVDVVAATLELDRFILGGNSMGGRVAWEYALAQPDRVAALVLLGPSGPADPAMERAYAASQSNIGFRILGSPVGRWLGQRITPRWLIARSLEQSVADPAQIDAAKVDLYWELLRYPGNRAATVQRFSTPREPMRPERLPGITAPTFILFGAEDQLIPPVVGRVMARAIAGAENMVLARVGHLPMEEAPDATAAAITDFLDRRLADPAAISSAAGP